MRSGGFDERQGKALACAQKNALAQMAESNLATNADIARLELKIVEMESRIIKVGINALFGFAGVIIAAIAVAVAILK